MARTRCECAVEHSAETARADYSTLQSERDSVQAERDSVQPERDFTLPGLGDRYRSWSAWFITGIDAQQSRSTTAC